MVDGHLLLRRSHPGVVPLKRWVVVALVAILLVAALWFKGGEFLCRLRGGTWVQTGMGNSICLTYQGE